MRRPLLFALLLAVAAVLNGCAFMSDEDKDFYGRGWVNPKELDQPTSHRPSGAPGGSASAPGGAAPLSTTSDPAHDSAWDVPGAVQGQ